MIVFQRIKWRNLLSTGNEFTQIDLNRSKTTLIIGENGAGKSSLLDALSFVLYGKAFRNVNKLQLVNTITNGHLEVEIDFTTDGCSYQVRRGAKPDFFEIYRDGELVNQESASRDYQAFLETEVLKMNYKAFKQVVVLGSADYVPFMHLKAADRRQVTEDIIDIQIFTVMAAMLKRKSDLTKDNLRVVGNNLEQLKNTLNIHRGYQSSFEKSQAASIEGLETSKHEKQQLVNSLVDEINDHKTRNEERAQQIAKLSDTTNTLRELEDLENALGSRLTRLKKEVTFLKTNEVCPTCTQEIVEQFRSEAVSSRSAEIVKIAEGSEKIGSRVSALRSNVNKLTEVAKGVQASQLAIGGIEREITLVKRQIAELDQKIDELKDHTETHTSKQMLDDLGVAIRNEASVIEHLYQLNEVHEYATVLLKDSGIKARLLKKYIPIINQLINKYLSMMNFFIHFELDETFAETIKSPYRDNFTYSSFSEGEKLRINLAILFTWREVAKMRNSMSTNLLIMDEIFDSSLDDSGVEDFLKILEELTGDTNIFVISHKSQMFDKFRGAIRFEKQGNFSKIAKEEV